MNILPVCQLPALQSYAILTLCYHYIVYYQFVNHLIVVVIVGIPTSLTSLVPLCNHCRYLLPICWLPTVMVNISRYFRHDSYFSILHVCCVPNILPVRQLPAITVDILWYQYILSVWQLPAVIVGLPRSLMPIYCQFGNYLQPL